MFADVHVTDFELHSISSTTRPPPLRFNNTTAKMANHTESTTTQNLVTKKVGSGYYTLVDPVNVKWLSAQHHSRMFTYPGCGICRKSLTANKAGKYVCPSHTVEKNPVPCFLARLLLQDTQSETKFWCTSFHDVTTKWMGISALEYEALSDDAKVCTSEKFCGFTFMIDSLGWGKLPVFTSSLCSSLSFMSPMSWIHQLNSTFHSRVQEVLIQSRTIFFLTSYLPQTPPMLGNPPLLFLGALTPSDLHEC